MPSTRIQPVQQRGVALVLTLVTIALVATMAAGIGTLVIGHYNRVTRDQDAAKALNYAECALNYQVQKLSVAIAGTAGTIPASNFGTSEASPLVVANIAPASPAGPLNSDLPLPVAGDICTAWVTNVPQVLGVYKFDPYATNYEIYGKATVNGVTRYVRAKLGGGKGIFDDWAVFGDRGVEMIGNMEVVGVVGSNGTIQINGSARADGQAVYGATAATDPNFPAAYFAAPIVLPTITEIANDISGAATGIDFFKTTNDNAALGRFNGNSPLPTAGIKVDKEVIVLTGKASGANFYLDNLDKKVDIRADVSPGPVNLWISTNTGEDISAQSKIRASNGPNATPTLNDSKLFRIYYRNTHNNGLHLNGGTEFYAMFYAIDQKSASDTTRIGNVDMNGGTDYHGAVLATEITKSNGNAKVVFPTNPGVSVGEGIVYYGIKQPWMEYKPVRGNS
ncbi:MAG: hypothetical protein V4671_14080 [Armatimonadota bacterium]